MIEDCFAGLRELCDLIDPGQIEGLVDVLYSAYRNGSRIFVFGNGGSGATASHFCEDLGKGTLRGPEETKRFRVVSLTDNTPYILAWANDEGYESIFEQQLRNLADEGDVAIAISGSGNSANVIRAMEYAISHGMVTVGMTGFDGGRLGTMVGQRVHIPSFDMGMVENFHLIVIHLVVDSLRKKMMKRAVFLDRDGVLNEERSDYVKSWREFIWLPGTKEALRRLRGDGLLTIVVTNQSAVGMGLLDEEGLEEIHSTMLEEIEGAGGGIDRIYYCPHSPDNACDCRIPRPGLLLRAAKDFDISLQDSYMISDGIEDLGMARELGCRTILVCSGHLDGKMLGQTGRGLHPDYALPDLSSAVEVILRLENRG